MAQTRVLAIELINNVYNLKYWLRYVVGERDKSRANCGFLGVRCDCLLRWGSLDTKCGKKPTARIYFVITCGFVKTKKAAWSHKNHYSIMISHFSHPVFRDY